MDHDTAIERWTFFSMCMLGLLNEFVGVPGLCMYIYVYIYIFTYSIYIYIIIYGLLYIMYSYMYYIYFL